MTEYLRDELAKSRLHGGESIHSVAKACNITRFAAARLRDQLPDGYR